jgi:hypothetical protein
VKNLRQEHEHEREFKWSCRDAHQRTDCDGARDASGQHV